jgi:hypothetical protein
LGTSFTLFRGSMSGDLTMTARLVPDSATTVTTAKDFGSGVRAVKMQIRGSL